MMAFPGQKLLLSPRTRGPYSFRQKIPAFAGKALFLFATLLAMTLILTPLPAFADKKEENTKIEEASEADEQKDEDEDDQKTEIEDTSVRYAPDFCDFEVIFPNEPYESRRCPSGPSSCYIVKGYTMVYDLKTTVDISVSCNRSSEAAYQQYSEPVMRAALNGMASESNLQDSRIAIEEQPNQNMRIATLSGTGQRGRQSRIYTAQLWIAENSVMTVEANITGRANHQADALFTSILRSIRKKQ